MESAIDFYEKADSLPNVKLVLKKPEIKADNFASHGDEPIMANGRVKPKSFYHHLPKVINKRNQLPSYLIFYATSRCNMTCSHCFYHDSLNKHFNELTVEEIDKFTKTMEPLLHLSITGGEPYIRNDIDKIVKVFYENTNVPIISIPSNGFYKDKMIEKITNMMEWCPELVLTQSISFDGLYEDHEKIRGIKGCFNRAMETVKALKELQKKYNRINIGTITTFTSQNQNKFTDIIKGIYELAEPDTIAINLVRGDPKEKVNFNLDMGLYREAVKFRDSLFYSKKMSGLHGFEGNKISTATRIILNEEITKISETNKYQMPCYSANLSGVMYPEGEVCPCEILDKSHAIGNIRDFNYDFRKLWLSQKAKDEVKFIRGTKCFCTHECFNTINILFNPKFYPKIAKIVATI